MENKNELWVTLPKFEGCLFDTDNKTPIGISVQKLAIDFGWLGLNADKSPTNTDSKDYYEAFKEAERHLNIRRPKAPIGMAFGFNSANEWGLWKEDDLCKTI